MCYLHQSKIHMGDKYGYCDLRHIFRLLCKLPNTYTFSKSLAEHVVKDLGVDLPVVIFRPSIGESLVLIIFCRCIFHTMC
jgi:hypothetical protein